MRHFFLLSALVVQASLLPAAFVINEVDPDTAGTDAAEFIELKGNPNESVVGLSLVFFNGSTSAAPPSYRAIDLVGQADANGYYLAGNTGVAGVQVTWPGDILQNGEDAIALYTRPSTDFTSVSLPSPTGLVDVVVTETGADADADWSGFGFTPVVYNENGGGNSAAHALARVPNVTGNFATQTPTPGASNEVSLPSAAQISPAGGINFGTFNESNEAFPVVRTVTLTNIGGAAFTVNSFGLDPASDPQFTLIAPAPVPTNLDPGQNMQLSVVFANADVAATQVFEGSISYSSTAATSPTGTITLRAEFVKVAVPATGLGQLLINEVSYNPNGGPGLIPDYNKDGNASTTEDEFVEIFNPGNSPVNVSGWKMQVQNLAGTNNGTHIFGDNTIIPAGGFLVGFGGGTPTGFAPGVATTWGLQLTNGGLKISVGDGTTVVDRVSYLDTNDTPDTDGFTNLPSIASGNSVGRRPDGSATFREFVHNDANVGDRPTPGASNNGGSVVRDWQLF